MIDPGGSPLDATEELPSVAPTGLRRTFEALAVRDFRILWFGFLGSWWAMQFQQVARGWLAYRLTGSAFAIGLVSLAMGLPRIVLSPVGGWLADRYAKRSVLLWTQLALAACGIATAVLQVAGVLDVTWLVLIGILQGTAFSFNMPARQAYLPQVVGSGNLLANAVALNNAGMNLSRVAAPAVAGLLIAVHAFGVAGVFFLTGVCYLWVWASVYRVSNPGAAVGSRQRMFTSVRDGFSYVWRTPSLLALMSLGFVPLALGMPYINLMPAVADGSFHGGARLLGLLLSIGGVGSLIGTLLVATMSRYPRKATLQLVLGVGFGLSLAGFAAFVHEGQLLPALPFLLLAGVCGDAYMALNSTLLMMSTEAGMYGRVMGVYMTAQSIRQVSVLPISSLADGIGTGTTLLGAGTLLALFVGGVAGFYPGYRRIGRAPAAVTAGA